MNIVPRWPYLCFGSNENTALYQLDVLQGASSWLNTVTLCFSLHFGICGYVSFTLVLVHFVTVTKLADHRFWVPLPWLRSGVAVDSFGVFLSCSLLLTTLPLARSPCCFGVCQPFIPVYNVLSTCHGHVVIKCNNWTACFCMHQHKMQCQVHPLLLPLCPVNEINH